MNHDAINLVAQFGISRHRHFQVFQVLHMILLRQKGCGHKVNIVKNALEHRIFSSAYKRMSTTVFQGKEE
jgi:hypothetical protein